MYLLTYLFSQLDCPILTSPQLGYDSQNRCRVYDFLANRCEIFRGIGFYSVQGPLYNN